MQIHCACGHEYTVHGEPCPDGYPGCLVWHGPGPEGYRCTRCRVLNVPRIDSIREEIGTVVFNVRAITNLSIYRGDE